MGDIVCDPDDDSDGDSAKAIIAARTVTVYDLGLREQERGYAFYTWGIYIALMNL